MPHHSTSPPERDRAATSAASLFYPGKVIADDSGALWIADSGHHRIVGMNRDGRTSAIIGCGRPGLIDGTYEEAAFRWPQGLALAASRDALYVADTQNHAIRRVDLAARRVDTLAGPDARISHASPATEAASEWALRSPWDLALDEEAGALYIALAGSGQVARMDLGSGALFALADDFSRPSGLALSPDRRRLYVADCASCAVRVMHLDTSEVVTLIGQGPGHVDGPRDQARLQHSMGLCLSPGGLIVADTYNHALRGINLRHSTVMTLWRGQDHTALCEPGGVTFDRVDRSYVVADTGQHRLVRVTRDAASASPIDIRGLAG